jgi:cytochrome c biogenesis protein CcdA
MDCKKTTPHVDVAKEKYGSRIELNRYNVQTNEGLETMLAFEARYGSQAGAPPKIFVGSKYLEGVGPITKNLDDLIAAQLAAGRPTSQPAGQPTGDVSYIEKKFRSFTFGAVAAAGFLDGLNPCAFATIVFLISVLTQLGKRRREIAMVGFFFALAVFTTYFLLGLGLLGVVKQLAVEWGLSYALTVGVAVFAALLGLWSLRDAIRIRRSGEVPKHALGLPKSVSRQIHRLIRTKLRAHHLIIGSLLVGFLVSLLESFCTGQVYVPTIMLVLRMPGSDWQAIGYLVLYNLMFIIPLVIVILAVYWGVGSDRLRQMARAKLGFTKFLMAGLFLALAALLFLTL